MLCQVDWLKYQEIISLLIANELYVNYQDSSGLFVLGIASREGHTKLVEYLLKSRRVSIDQQDKDGVTSLMEASAGGHILVARLLSWPTFVPSS